jgi:DNA-binding MarR family transcriptional regulator
MNDEKIQLAELFHRINRRIMGRMGRMIKDKQLSMTEMMVLWTVGKRKICRASDLVDAIGVPASTLTGVLDRLESQHFLVRIADSHDRRSVQIQATETLDAFIKQRMAQMNEILRGAFSTIPEDRIRQLEADLQVILHQLEEEDGCAKHG